MNGQREGLGRTALITGASAGIGEALAEVFAARGFDLVLTARRAERLIALGHRLEQAHGIHARAIPADLARPKTAGNILDALERDHVTIDVLVNNAGYGMSELYRDASWEAHRDFLQVMMIAPCEMTHRLLPGMQSRGYGRILNVASVVGFLPPMASPTLYGAVKAMLIGFSEALHAEQKGTGVHVTVLCPGLTTTEFHDVNGTRTRVGRLPKFLWLSAKQVAEDGARAVMQGDPMCIPGTLYKVLVPLLRFIPHRLAAGQSARSRTIGRRKSQR